MSLASHLKSQNFEQLWNQVELAAKKDQPRTQIGILDEIQNLAVKKKSYGNLLAATLRRASVEYEISPDSLSKWLDELELMEKQTTNYALRAVLDAVLAKVYEAHPGIEESATKAEGYRAKALSHPDILAKITDKDYQPFIEQGIDSQLFGHDLLHVIGLETNNRALLHDWYLAHGNREAACLLATDLANGDIQKLDSIIAAYQDLSVCGHAAIARFNAMPTSNNEERRACYEYANQALDKWSDWKEMNKLRNAKGQLITPQFFAEMESYVFHPQQQPKIVFEEVRNLSVIHVRIFRTLLNGDNSLLRSYNDLDEKQIQKIKKQIDKVPVQSCDISFSGKPNYELNTDSLLLPQLSPGIYLLEFSADNKEVGVQRKLIAVSNIRLVWQAQPQERVRLVVVRADDGQPVKGARIQASYDIKDKIKQFNLTTNKHGEAFITLSSKRPTFFVSTAEDKALPAQSEWISYSYSPQEQPQKKVRIFTDRSVYRPGQTVYVNLMAWSVRGTDTKAMPNEQVSLTLRDANGREIEQKQLATDDFGTAFTTFHLPSSGLTGQFVLTSSLGNGYQSFQVEEYKRPTFEVHFNEYKEKYAPGDTVTMQGSARTYSGLAVEGAKVSYKVVRRPSLWWRWWRNDLDVETVYTGETTTDNDGLFKVSVPLIMDKEKSGFYRFEVSADVTDQAGESHQGTTSLPIGSKEAILSTNLADKILDTERKPFALQYRNAAGKDVKATVRYGIFATTERMEKERMVEKLNLTTPANTQIDLPKLKSGAWTLFAVCGNDTLQHDFILFSLDDKRPAVPTHDWFYQTSETFYRNNKPVCIQIGSSDKNQHIVYSVISGEKVLENGRIDQSNAVTLMKFKYKKEYGDGIRLCFAWVHDGVTYCHSTTISRPLPESQLKLSWHTFRDRLTPGQKETWTLEVKNPDGTPANAQLMATLYDKSLDQLYPHQWNDAIHRTLYLPYTKWDYFGYGGLWAVGQAHFRPLTEKELSLDQFRYFYYENLCPVILYDRIFPQRCAKSARLRLDSVLEESTVANGASNQSPEPDATTKAEAKTPIQLRENLEETAFFYPQLQTDSTGLITLKFQLPESVTTWRMMGLAHDVEMRHGLIEADAVAQKDVMVQPNLPRFARLGDHLIVYTRISNTTADPKSGVTRLQLLNPTDETVVYEEEKTFSTEAGQTVSEKFNIAPEVLDGHEGLLIVRITAQGEDFNDGEQHYLPILTNKKYVTTSLPFTQDEPGKLSLNLKELYQGNGIERPSLTVEYTSNPTWLILQALPYVGTVNEKNAISLSAALFANTLGRYIVHKNPRLKTVFKQWEQEEGTETSLQSQLEKNEQLKELVLEETPWVSDAQSEQAQRKAIATFFNDNQINYSLSKAINNLQLLQNTDGSFSWWKGMEGSFYMTVAVTKMLTRLQVMTGKDSYVEGIAQKAFQYLDKEVAKRVADLKKQEKKDKNDIFPSDELCDYLYINALAQRKETDDTKYLLKLMARRPSVLTIYGKANTAVILAQYGHVEKAKEFLKSLKEFSVYTKEMGRYFDTPRAQYSWFDYRIPSQVAAIEAIRMLSPDDIQTLGEMRQWLLQAKRTQAWDTPFNAVAAIWAFADNGQISQLSENNTPAKLSIDKELIDEQGTAGLGYVRHTQQLTAIPQTLTIEKSSQGTSWGAAYAQYLQPMDETKEASAGISVKRELLDKDGKPAIGLKMGARVRVRITIVADRDYDFVMVNDLRAACLEPITQQSGYQLGYYLETRDQTTRYFFDTLAKGKHVVETEYYIDREGDYLSGICTAQCAYAPEYNGRTGTERLIVTH